MEPQIQDINNNEREEEDIIIEKCFMCKMEFTYLEYHRHYYDCRRKNTIRAINLQKNKTYINNGKAYMISAVEHVRKKRMNGEVLSIIVKLYCDEDKTSIKMAFTWDKRFMVDENNNIIIP